MSTLLHSVLRQAQNCSTGAMLSGILLLVGPHGALHAESSSAPKAQPYVLPPSLRSASTTAAPRPNGYSENIRGVGALSGFVFSWNRGCWHSNRPLTERENRGLTAQQGITAAIGESHFPPGSRHFINTINYLIITPPERSHLSSITKVSPNTARAAPTLPKASAGAVRTSTSPYDPHPQPESVSVKRPEGFPRIIRGSGGWPGWLFTWQDGAWRSDRALRIQFDSTAARQQDLYRWTSATAFPSGSRPAVAADGHVWIFPPPESNQRRHESEIYLVATKPATTQRLVSHLPPPKATQPIQTQIPRVQRTSNGYPQIIRASAGFPGWIFTWTGSSWKSDRPLRTQFASESDMRNDLLAWTNASGFPERSNVAVDSEGYVFISPQ